jgi:hypothetical protein
MEWATAGVRALLMDHTSKGITLTRYASGAIWDDVGHCWRFLQSLQRIDTDTERNTGYAAIETHHFELGTVQLRQDVALSIQNRISL